MNIESGVRGARGKTESFPAGVSRGSHGELSKQVQDCARVRSVVWAKHSLRCHAVCSLFARTDRPGGTRLALDR